MMLAKESTQSMAKHTMTFDIAHKVAYIYAPGCDQETNKGRVDRTVDVELKKTTAYVDLDKEGNVIGVEILATSRASLTEIMEQFTKKFRPRKKKARAAK